VGKVEHSHGTFLKGIDALGHSLPLIEKKFGHNLPFLLFSQSKNEGGISIMLIIPVKEGESIDRALKKFKKKFEKTGVVKELRNRQAYTKKSVSRREEIKKAAYISTLRREEM